MPLYDYQCKGGHFFEAWAKVDKRRDTKCPECGKASKIQILSAPAAIVFHSGWYDNIDPKPIYCSTPQELRDACDKKGVYSRYLEESSFRTKETVQDTLEAIDDQERDKEHRRQDELRAEGYVPVLPDGRNADEVYGAE